MKQDLIEYIGKVIYKTESFCVFGKWKDKKNMYFICGVDKISDRLICIAFEELMNPMKKYQPLDITKNMEIISLSEAYDICYKYIHPMLDIYKAYKISENFDEKKLKDFKKTLSRLNTTLYNIYHFKDFKCTYKLKEEDNRKYEKMIEKEKQKWYKGLRRIKKRTYHYFSDETFDFLVHNYRDKIHINCVNYEHLKDEIFHYVEILFAIEKLLL